MTFPSPSGRLSTADGKVITSHPDQDPVGQQRHNAPAGQPPTLTGQTVTNKKPQESKPWAHFVAGALVYSLHMFDKG